MNVQEAFAGDNVVREFEEEKEQLMQDSRAKTIDLTMPGASYLLYTVHIYIISALRMGYVGR